jgi:hypothetical protein
MVLRMKYAEAAQNIIFINYTDDDNILHETIGRVARENRIKSVSILIPCGANSGNEPEILAQ